HSRSSPKWSSFGGARRGRMHSATPLRRQPSLPPLPTQLTPAPLCGGCEPQTQGQGAAKALDLPAVPLVLRERPRVVRQGTRPPPSTRKPGSTAVARREEAHRPPSAKPSPPDCP